MAEVNALLGEAFKDPRSWPKWLQILDIKSLQPQI